MRLGFGRFFSGLKEKLPGRPAFAASAAPVAVASAPVRETSDIDLRDIWRRLVRQRAFVIVPTLAVLLLSTAVVNLITPRYKSEAKILIDGRENIFLRPTGERAEDRGAVDPEAVASQVQLLLSRDLAREVIKKEKLASLPEFDPVLKGVSPVKSLLSIFGITRDPFKMTPEERVLDAYYERLQAFAVDKSRVMVVEFQSSDPDLAARVANAIAAGYLVLQQSARQNQAKSASAFLAGEIEALRKKVPEAEAKAEAFRSKSNLFVGINNTTLSNQQLGELNTQINAARSLRSDTESKARLIRDLLHTGQSIEASEILNSELIRRLSEQRVTLHAQLAEQSSTLLGGHPRIRELRAQLADLESQTRNEAMRIARAFQNDAKIADARLASLQNNLEQLKRQAATTNGQDVELRALEREARAQRDLLESYLAKYREATARENIDAAPADGRIISRAIVTNTPAYPKKLAIVLIATLATLVLTTGYIATSELLSMTAPLRQPVRTAPRLVPLQMPSGLSEIERLAAALSGNGTRKMTVIGAGAGDGVAMTALTLSRFLARKAKVVLIDFAANAPTLRAVSSDPLAPGLTDLMAGSASFGQIITRDRLSAVHLVGAGRNLAERSLLQLPRVKLALDALTRAYEFMVLDAGAAEDLPSSLIAAQAHAIIVPQPRMGDAARSAMRDRLLAAGFTGVTVLNETPVLMPERAGGVAAA